MITARPFKCAVAVCTLMMLSTTLARADWLPQFTGFTNFGLSAKTGLPDSVADGTVSFAVYNNESGTWIGDFGDKVEKSIRVFDTLTCRRSEKVKISGVENLSQQAQNASYVYFYEVANTQLACKGVKGVLDDLELEGSGASITGVGFLSKYVFNENGTPVDKKNPQLGPASNSIDTPGDGTPTFSGFQFSGAPFVKTCSDVESPQSGRVSDDLLEYLWKEIEKKQTSSVIFFTSDSPPEYCSALLSGKTDCDDCGHCDSCCRKRCGKDGGDIPCPVPEPAGLVILLTGVPVAGLALLRLSRPRP